jgi:hypothetical protein
MLISALISGGIGLAGVSEIAGIHHLIGISAGYGTLACIATWAVKCRGSLWPPLLV